MSIILLLAAALILYGLYRVFVRHVSDQNALRDWILEQGGIHQMEEKNIERLEDRGFEVDEYYENGLSLKKIGASLISEVQILYGQDRERSVHIEVEVGEAYEHDDTIRSRRGVERGDGVVDTLEQLVEDLLEGFIDDPALGDALRQHFALSDPPISSDSDSENEKRGTDGSEGRISSATGNSIPESDWGLLRRAYSEDGIEPHVMDHVIQDLYKEDGLHPTKIRIHRNLRHAYPNYDESEHDFPHAAPSLMNYLKTDGTEFPNLWDNWFIDAYPDVFRWFMSHDSKTIRQMSYDAAAAYGPVSEMSLDQMIDFYRKTIDAYADQVTREFECLHPDGWASESLFHERIQEDTFSPYEIFPCLSAVELEEKETLTGIRALSNGTYPREEYREDRNGDRYRWHNFFLCRQSGLTQQMKELDPTEKIGWQALYDRCLTASQFERDLDYEIARGRKCKLTVQLQDGELIVLSHSVFE